MASDAGDPDDDESFSSEDSEHDAKQFNVPGEVGGIPKPTELLACVKCRLILAKKDWHAKKECPNCTDAFFIRADPSDEREKDDAEHRVKKGTTRKYDGHLAVCNPKSSWAARYLQLPGGALPGVYALQAEPDDSEHEESEDEDDLPASSTQTSTQKTDNAGVISIKKAAATPARPPRVESDEKDPFPLAWMFTELGGFDYEKFKMRRMRTGNLARELPEKLVKIDNPKDVSGPYGGMLRAVLAKERGIQKENLETWTKRKEYIDAKAKKEQLTESEKAELKNMRVTIPTDDTRKMGFRTEQEEQDYTFMAIANTEEPYAAATLLGWPKEVRDLIARRQLGDNVFVDALTEEMRRMEREDDEDQSPEEKKVKLKKVLLRVFDEMGVSPDPAKAPKRSAGGGGATTPAKRLRRTAGGPSGSQLARPASSAPASTAPASDSGVGAGGKAWSSSDFADTESMAPSTAASRSSRKPSSKFGAGDDAWSSSNFGDDPLVEEADDSNANPFDSALARRLGQDKAARPSAPMPPARPAAPAPAGAARPPSRDHPDDVAAMLAARDAGRRPKEKEAAAPAASGSGGSPPA